MSFVFFVVAELPHPQHKIIVRPALHWPDLAPGVFDGVRCAIVARPNSRVPAAALFLLSGGPAGGQVTFIESSHIGKKALVIRR